MANAQLAKTVCCDPEAAAGQCNTPSRLDQALARTSNFVRYVIQSEQGPEPVVSFDDIRSEIDRGRVVATRVGWSDNSGHFQAIFGYVESASGRQFIRVTDPIYREVDIVFSDFASRYAGGGWWNVAYFTGPATEAVAGGAGTPGMAMAENAMPASESDLMGA